MNTSRAYLKYPEFDMLRERILSALVGIPILLAAIWFGSPWLSIITALFVLLGITEFYRLSSSAGWQPFVLPGSILALLFILNTHSDDSRTTGLLISAAILLTLIRLLWRPDRENALVNWAVTISGIFYIGWTMSHFVLLRDLDDGRNWIFLMIISTFACDTAAFFVGKAFGRHRMAPNISPGKTWEGAVGGTIGAMASTIIIATITGLDEVGYVWLLPLGFLISAFGQMGDLVESMLKRSAGVKESGNIIPGHGGILDRLDSLLFTIVLVYYYVTWIVI